MENSILSGVFVFGGIGSVAGIALLDRFVE